MATTLLEQTRAYHEDIERFERVIVELQSLTPKTHKESIIRDHKVNKYLNLIIDRSNKLRSIYEDKDGTRAREIGKLGGPEILSQFYAGVQNIRAYYTKYPDLTVDRPENVAYSLVMADDELARFSGEEGTGRFLDLHEYYLQFINLPKNKETGLEYTTYLKTFSMFDYSLSFKDTHYKRYLINLLAYLDSFLERALPLFDKAGHFAKLEEEFNKLWEEKGVSFRWSTAEEEAEVKRFEEETKSISNTSTSLDSIDGIDDAPPPSLMKSSENGGGDADLLDGFSSAKDLESLGMEKLKAELQKRGLKCGGTLTQRATRLWDAMRKPKEAASAPAAPAAANSGTPGKKKRRRNKKDATAARNVPLMKEITRLEYLINKTAALLQEHIENTKLNIEKKQSRGPVDIEEIEEDEEGSDVEAEEVEEEVIIGKQNYPVGWDGKPIPYWLYKLHGLGIEYKCEICGNQSYWGRRAFERHFQEWRHAHGMRCLGVPNTRHFHEVTKIQDAIALWQKLKEDTVAREWKPDDEMEFEDAEGNVFNKKTYEDLQRQGLLSGGY